MKEEFFPPSYDGFRRHLQGIAKKYGTQIYTYWNEFITKGKLPSYEWLVNRIFIEVEFKNGRRDRDRYDRFNAPCKVLDIFQFLSEEFIEHVAKSIKKLNAQRIIEIGAGDGFLSAFLKERGIDILPTDDYSRPYINYQEHC